MIEIRGGNMSKLMINNSVDVLLYPVKSDSLANVDNTLNEWIRFSSYIKPEELLFLNKLNNKAIEQLTTDEIEKYYKLKKLKGMSGLFIKYKNRNCSKEEHDRVVEYMDNSLKCFMRERLTEEEFEQSYKLLSQFSRMSLVELDEYIDKQMINYENLTLLEAYILYQVKEIKYCKQNREQDEKFRNDQIEITNALKRSLIRDYGYRN